MDESKWAWMFQDWIEVSLADGMTILGIPNAVAAVFDCDPGAGKAGVEIAKAAKHGDGPAAIVPVERLLLWASRRTKGHDDHDAEGCSDRRLKDSQAFGDQVVNRRLLREVLQPFVEARVEYVRVSTNGHGGGCIYLEARGAASRLEAVCMCLRSAASGPADVIESGPVELAGDDPFDLNEWRRP